MTSVEIFEDLGQRDAFGPLVSRTRKFLVSSVPSDSHMWNLVALQILLEEMGHEVVNLGACVPTDLLLRQCHAERPDCVVISSVNGHGHIDGARLITALRADPGLAGLNVVIGGKLGVEGEANSQFEQELLELGFDAVFHVGAGDSAHAIEAFRRYIGSHVQQVT
ncbi:cobalamin-dependent protein [Nonomuraea sp. B10E15]|uniref:cobalamin B12-binding domain-containing protein n=1 Tax=unclassified Nonomuraea TaxID=2593643 RepID=UPI00325C5B51